MSNVGVSTIFRITKSLKIYLSVVKTKYSDDDDQRYPTKYVFGILLKTLRVRAKSVIRNRRASI